MSEGSEEEPFEESSSLPPPTLLPRLDLKADIGGGSLFAPGGGLGDGGRLVAGAALDDEDEEDEPDVLAPDGCEVSSSSLSKPALENKLSNVAGTFGVAGDFVGDNAFT